MYDINFSHILKEYEIDPESTSDKIILRKKLEGRTISIKDGYLISEYQDNPFKYNANLFATLKQAKSSLAMSQLSQIFANDERFGGIITEEEWRYYKCPKYNIERIGCSLSIDCLTNRYNLLSFHTEKQARLFLKENEDLIKQYYAM